MRLIDADALKKAIIKHLCVKSENNLLPAEKSIYNLIDEQQTIEQPKKGHWENGHCSFCGEDIASRLDTWTNVQWYIFCPKCGADMREDGERE